MNFTGISSIQSVGSRCEQTDRPPAAADWTVFIQFPRNGSAEPGVRPRSRLRAKIFWTSRPNSEGTCTPRQHSPTHVARWRAPRHESMLAGRSASATFVCSVSTRTRRSRERGARCARRKSRVRLGKNRVHVTSIACERVSSFCNARRPIETRASHVVSL